jgi:TrpR family trp operon transcriptional repressor
MIFLLSFPSVFFYVSFRRNITGKLLPNLWDFAKASSFYPVFLQLAEGGCMNEVTKELIEIFARTKSRQEMEVLFREIFTPSEIDTLSLRWQLLKDLHEGKTQRKIAADRKISLCKITRGSKLLKAKDSYLKKVLDRLYEDGSP